MEQTTVKKIIWFALILTPIVYNIVNNFRVLVNVLLYRDSAWGFEIYVSVTITILIVIMLIIGTVLLLKSKWYGGLIIITPYVCAIIWSCFTLISTWVNRYFLNTEQWVIMLFYIVYYLTFAVICFRKQQKGMDRI